MVFHWSLSDNKSSHVSWALLNILADLNNAVVWMVSTRFLISKFSSPRTNPLVTVPSASIISGITVTFMFRSFFRSLARSSYLSLFSLSFNRTVYFSYPPRYFFWFFLSSPHVWWYPYYHYYYYQMLNGFTIFQPVTKIMKSIHVEDIHFVKLWN